MDYKSILDFAIRPPETLPEAPLPERAGGYYGSILDFAIRPDLQDRELEAARKKSDTEGASFAGMPRGDGNAGRFIIEHSLPFVSALAGKYDTDEYGAAMKRYQQRTATKEDIQKIADFEKRGEDAAKRSTVAEVGHAAAGIPAILGEFAVGGAAVRGLKVPGAIGRAMGGSGIGGQALRGAAATPFIPSTYLARGAENQLANPDQSTFQSYAPAVALAASQNAVLGQLQGLLSGAPITRAGRILGKTVVGMGESAGADAAATSLDRVTKAVTGKTLGLDTKWGVLGSVLRGDEGSKKQAIVQFATFSIFSAMHSGRATVAPEVFRAAVESAKPEEIAEVGRQVQEAAQAGQDALAKFEAKLPDTPVGDLGRAYVDAVRTDPLLAMGDEGPIPARQRPQEPRSAAPEPSERPPEAPAGDAKPEIPAEVPETAHSTAPKVDESSQAADLMKRLGVRHTNRLASVEKGKDGEVVGALFADWDTPDGQAGEFSFDVGVDPAAQGRGIGKTLIDRALSQFEAEKGQYESASVRVRVTNPAVEAILRERGFKVEDSGDGRFMVRSDAAQPLRPPEPEFAPGESPAELSMTERIQKSRAEFLERSRLHRERQAAKDAAAEEKRQAEILSRRKENLKLARLKLVEGTNRMAGEMSWQEREAQAKVDGVRTYASEIAGRLDPRSLSEGEMQELREVFGVKDDRALLRLPIFMPVLNASGRRIETLSGLKGSLAFTRRGGGLDSLAQELGLGTAERHGADLLMEHILANRPIEVADNAGKRELEQDLAKQQEQEAARVAAMSPEERAAHEAELAAFRERQSQPFDWEDVGDAREPSIGEKVWKYADDLEKQARKELDDLGEVPFTGFDPTRMISPIAKLLAAKVLKGGVTFAQFSAGTLKKYGEAVRPHLKAIWDEAQAINAGRQRLLDRVRATQKPAEAKGGTMGPKREAPPVEQVAPPVEKAPSLAADLTEAINKKATWLPAKERERLLQYLFEGSFRDAGQTMGMSHEGVRKSATIALEKLRANVEEFAAFTGLEDLQNAIAKDNLLQRMERIQAGEATEADVKAIGGDVNMEVMKKLSRLKIQQLREEREYDKAVDDLVKLGKDTVIPAELRARLKLEEGDAIGRGEGVAQAEGEAPRRPGEDRGPDLFDFARRSAKEDPVPPETDAPATEGAAAEAPTPEVKGAQSLRGLLRGDEGYTSEAPHTAPKFNLFDFLTGESAHYWFPTGVVIGDLAKKAMRAIFGKARGNDPDWKPDADPNLDNPRTLPPARVMRKTAYNQVGSSNATPEQVATTTWMYSSQVGRDLGNYLETRYAGRENPFKDMPDWQDKIEAEIREPGSQHFNAEQNKFVDDVWLPLLEKVHGWFEAEGIKFYNEDGSVKTKEQMLREGYFHRGVVDPRTDAEKAAQPPGTRKPGYKPGYKKNRNDATLAENEEAGVEYMGPYESIVDFVRESYREIVDKRFADDPMMGGEDLVPKLVARYMAANKEWLDKMPKEEYEKAKGELIRLAKQNAQGNVSFVPAMKGKMYPPEGKKQADAVFGERSGPILKKAAALNQEIRNLTLGADASHVLMQTLPALFSNPIRWARSIAKVPRALFDGALLAKEAARRPEMAEAMPQWVEGGGSLSQPVEGTIAKGKSAVSRLPYVGKVFDNVYGRASQAMSQTLDLVKLELFIANKQGVEPKEWPRLIEAIENSMGQGRMEKLGMTPERAFLERTALLAPSYYRSAIGLLKHAFTRGAAGKYARKSLGSLAAGVMGTAIAALYALKSQGEISDEEMEERLNPARGKFLMIPIPMAGGKKMEVGFGGLYVSMARTLGNSVRYAEGQTDENPAARWYRGHAGSLVRSAWDIGSGQDFLGRPVSPLEVAAKSVSPLSLQAGLMGEGNALQRIAGVATSGVGLRSYPGTDEAADLDRVRLAAQREYGKRYEDLDYAEQAKLVRQFGPEKEPASPAAIARAMQNDQLRAQRLRGMVSKGTREVLEELKVAVPSYDAKLSVQGVPVPLTKSRQDLYEKLLAEEYDRGVAAWPLDRLREAPTKAREAFIKRSFEAAKVRAKSRLVRAK